MYDIIMISFNKIKFRYLIQLWEDVTKIIRNVKNANVEKMLWWRDHLNILPPPYVTISHHSKISSSPSLGDALFERPLGGFWMGCSCLHLSHKNVPKCGKGVQAKKSLWVKNARPSPARDTNVTEKPSKTKAAKSSQGRAQSWWRLSRAWEARVWCRWQEKVARKRKNLWWDKTTITTNNIRKTSLRFYQASTIPGSFVEFTKVLY